MALFSVNMPCSLCREPIRVGDDTIATTHFIGDATDPLWRYSDSVMHRRCFDAWEHRDEFSRRYRQTMGAMYPHVEDYVNFPGPPGFNVVREPPPPPPPLLPTHFCPNCNAGLTVGHKENARLAVGYDFQVIANDGD